ncbi:hypothetical protein BY996DRAFT_6536274 [Phakopsora pachyrhizi]|nr:hypothetical protein BY996DRAFT_6536274 [Phakopsora pachyrhizi]
MLDFSKEFFEGVVKSYHSNKNTSIIQQALWKDFKDKELTSQLEEPWNKSIQEGRFTMISTSFSKNAMTPYILDTFQKIELLRKSNNKKDVAEYCTSCDRCQKANKATGKRFGLLQRIEEPTASWEVINMDWVISLPPGGAAPSSSPPATKEIWIPTNKEIVSSLLPTVTAGDDGKRKRMTSSPLGYAYIIPVVAYSSVDATTFMFREFNDRVEGSSDGDDQRGLCWDLASEQARHKGKFLNCIVFGRQLAALCLINLSITLVDRCVSLSCQICESADVETGVEEAKTEKTKVESWEQRATVDFRMQNHTGKRIDMCWVLDLWILKGRETLFKPRTITGPVTPLQTVLTWKLRSEPFLRPCIRPLGNGEQVEPERREMRNSRRFH